MSQFGGSIICLTNEGFNRSYKLYSKRPDASLNRAIRSQYESEAGRAIDDVSGNPKLIEVEIHGALEQRAGYHEPCGGWSDGHDAVTERLCSAFETSDVLLNVDSPGGAHAGLEQAIERAQKAKSKYGRYVIAYANEMIGSAAYYWTAMLADEIWGPKSMLVGCIGARGAHQSVAGLLAKEGVEFTYFYWPGEGKIAFAEELPLSEVARKRGNRDVTLAGMSFGAAVAEARGMSIDDIIALDADMLGGQDAVDAGLVDGVGSLDEVTQYALALADRDPDMKPVMKSGKQNTRSEDPNPKEPQTPTEQRSEGDDPDHDGDHHDGKQECAKCGQANDDDAKYCDKCGSMLDEGNPEEPKEPKEPTGNDDTRTETNPNPDEPGQNKEARAPRAQSKRIANVSPALSLEEILGLRKGASAVAQKTAALALANLAHDVMAATSSQTPDEARGRFQALVDDAAESAENRAIADAAVRRDEWNERMGLLNRLNSANIPGYSRGDLFADVEINGKMQTRPAPIYADMKLSQLRGLVQAKTGEGGTQSRRTPYEPNREGAKRGQVNSHAEELQGSDIVKRAGQISTASSAQLARSAAALTADGKLN